MRSRFRQFGEIMKVEDQADGTIMVYGVASSGAQDAVGETITPDAMKSALPDYSKFPALREMHSPSAAGRVMEADVDADGMTNIVAHVVDPVAITKVKTKTYAGFSIGGKVLKRDATNKSVITGLRLVEISLVDSPCNPDAVLNMWKADMSDYTPTGDAVVAEAEILAKAAGSKKYKDFLFKAREGLIAKALEADLGDDDEADTSEAVAAAGDVVATTEEDTAKAELVTAEVDPVDAFNAALAAAVEKVAPVAQQPATGPFINMAKAGAAVALIGSSIRASDDLAKGLYTVERTARILESIGSIAQSVIWEEGAENDTASKLPEQALALVNGVKTFLIEMVNEEVAELIAQMTAQNPALMLSDIIASPADGDMVVIELANEIVDLVKADTVLIEKAGARNSKGDAAKIQQSHDHMAALGATCDSANCSGDAEKVVALAAENDRLAKALTDAAPQIGKITKRFDDQVDTLKGTIADLTKRLEQVEAAPAAPKTIANTLRAITKAEDANPATGGNTPALSAEEFKKHLDELPEQDRGELLLRVALSNPKLVQTARAAA